MHSIRRSALRNTIVAATAVGALALTGCAGGGGDDGVGEDGSVTITYRTWLPTPDQWEPIIAAFEEEHPDINIQFEGADSSSNYLPELDNLILAGEVPDVYGIHADASFDDYADYAMNVDDYAGDWIDGIKPELLESTTTSDGDLRAIPVLTAGSEFYLYNKTLFDELGLELPTDWDSLVAVSQAAQEAGYTGVAMGAGDGWHVTDFFVWLATQFGEGDEIYDAATGDIDWDSPALIAAAEQWKAFFDEGVFQEGATSTTLYPSARDDYLLARRALMMPTGSWHVSAALAGNSETPGSPVEADELGMALMPSVGENEGFSTTGVDYAFALSAELEGAKLEAANTFAEFMAVGQGQQLFVNTLQGFPAASDISVEIAEDESAIALESVEAVTTALQEAKHPRKLRAPGNDSLESDLAIVLQNIANGADIESELATLNQ